MAAVTILIPKVVWVAVRGEELVASKRWPHPEFRAQGRGVQVRFADLDRQVAEEVAAAFLESLEGVADPGKRAAVRSWLRQLGVLNSRGATTPRPEWFRPLATRDRGATEEVRGPAADVDVVVGTQLVDVHGLADVAEDLAQLGIGSLGFLKVPEGVICVVAVGRKPGVLWTLATRPSQEQALAAATFFLRGIRDLRAATLERFPYVEGAPSRRWTYSVTPQSRGDEPRP